jgi:thiamine-phosphate pyrophosphorylase
LRGLYPIIDLDALDRSGHAPIAVAERVLNAAPPLLQLRAKHASSRRTLALLRELSPLCRRRGTLLFANDRPDLAVLSGADGVHLGQDDLPIEAARRIAPGLRIGVSTHDLRQLEDALSHTPDYVAFGPVFGTTSKEHPDPIVGLDALSAAARRAGKLGIPVVAIGGIDLTRAPAIAAHGAIGAVIGALLDTSLPAIEARAQALHEALGGTPMSSA